jgi:hypothetical protein
MITESITSGGAIINRQLREILFPTVQEPKRERADETRMLDGATPMTAL